MEPLTSRTQPTRVFCVSSRLTPEAVLILVFSMLASVEEAMACDCCIAEAFLMVGRCN